MPDELEAADAGMEAVLKTANVYLRLAFNGTLIEAPRELTAAIDRERRRFSAEVLRRVPCHYEPNGPGT